MTPRETASQLTGLLAETVAALDAAGNPVDTSAIHTGEIAWSDCCDLGHAYIRLVRIGVVPHGSSFPNVAVTAANCPAEPAALVELGVLRCWPTLDNSGNAPAPEEENEASLLAIQDMSVIYSVLTDYDPPWAQQPVAIDTWAPLGPSGACAGGAWQFWLSVAICPPQTSPGGSP